MKLNEREFEEAFITFNMQLIKVVGDNPHYVLSWPEKGVEVKLKPIEFKSVSSFRTRIMFEWDILPLAGYSQGTYEGFVRGYLARIEHREVPAEARMLGDLLDGFKAFTEQRASETLRHRQMDYHCLVRKGRFYFKPRALEAFLFESHSRYHFQRQSIPREALYTALKDYDLHTNEVIKVGRRAVRVWSVPADIWEPKGEPLFEEEDEGEAIDAGVPAPDDPATGRRATPP